MRAYLFIFLKGLAMGAADVVPGVSGGTIAFITGIYERLLNSINSVSLKTIGILRKEGIKSAWKSIDGTFLISLILGIGISIVSLAKLLTYLLKDHPVLLWSFFFGLVLASAIYVGKQVQKWNSFSILSIIVGIGVTYLITTIPPSESNSAYWFIFLSGVIAICAMILPGISGSFILLLLGSYQLILSALSNMDLIVIAVFVMGCIFGLLSFSRVLAFLLKKYFDITIALLTGFLLGSLNKIWPWKEKLTLLYTHSDGRGEWIESNVSPFNFENPQLLWSVLLAITGFTLIFVLEKFSPKNTS